jgi:hypothetical protein
MVSYEELFGGNEQRAFTHHLADLVRTDRHQEAEAELSALLRQSGDEIAAACLAVGLQQVTMLGWDEVNARIAEVSAAGKPVTALGLDITYIQSDKDAQGRHEQLLETSYYSDASGYVFSAASRAQILAAAPIGGETPDWVGSFEDIDNTMKIQGLAPIVDALDRRQRQRGNLPESDQRRKVATFLGEWFRHLRVHQAIARDLETWAIAGGLPVIVGSNESAPYFEAVYLSKAAAAR